jgi:hypothetical protein
MNREEWRKLLKEAKTLYELYCRWWWRFYMSRRTPWTKDKFSSEHRKSQMNNNDWSRVRTADPVFYTLWALDHSHVLSPVCLKSVFKKLTTCMFFHSSSPCRLSARRSAAASLGLQWAAPGYGAYPYCWG